MNQGTIKYAIELDTIKFEANAEQAKRIIEQLGGTMVNEGNKIDDAFNAISDKMKIAFSVGSVSYLAGEIFSVRNEFQQLEIAFGTMLQSKSKADALMSQMMELAAKTPFGMKEVANGAKRLLAFQVPANEVIDTLRRMGDVAAGLGVPMEQLIHVYGQVKAQGKLMTNDLYQFMNAGIPIIAELAKVTGKTETQIKDMVSAGQIGFTEIQAVFKRLTSEGGMFNNLMEEQSKSLGGQLANLQDNLDALYNEVGKHAQGAFSTAIQGANLLVENYQTIGKILAMLVATYGTYRTAVMVNMALTQTMAAAAQKDALAKGLQTLATKAATLAQQGLNAAMRINPFVAAASAVVALGTAMWLFAKNTNEAQASQQRFNEEQARQTKLIEQEKNEIDSLIATLKDENATKGEKLLAFEQLQRLYPELFAKYKTEEQLLQNINTIEKERNALLSERQLAMSRNYTDELQAQIKTLEAEKNSTQGTYKKIKLADEIKQKTAELEKARKKLGWQTTLHTEKLIADMSQSEQAKAYNLLIEEYNRRHNAKENALHAAPQKGQKKDLRHTSLPPIASTGYEAFSDADLGYLIEKTKQLKALGAVGAGAATSVAVLKEQIRQTQTEIENLQKQSAWASTEEKNQHLAQIQAKQKQLEVQKKELETLTGKKKETTKSQKNKTQWDEAAFALQTQRKQIDNELALERHKIEQMQAGYEKELALIRFHHKEKAEAIKRSTQDATLALEKEKQSSAGQMSLEAYTARKNAIEQSTTNDNAANNQLRTAQEESLLNELLSKYKGYEEQRSQILKSYAQERSVLERQIAQATSEQKRQAYQKALARLQRQEAEDLLKAEINASDANTAIARLFGDMQGKSIADLKALQQAAQEAFEQLKQAGNLSAESLKAIEDKLKSNKALTHSLSPLLKQIAIDFKTLANKKAPLEDKQTAFNNINNNLQKSVQGLHQFAQGLEALGVEGLTQITGMLSNITQQGTQFASMLKGLGVGDGAAIGIGLGLGVITNIIGSFRKARQEREAQEAQYRAQQIEHEKKLAELQRQRLVELKQYSNAFVSNKLGKHLEHLNIYKNDLQKLAADAKKIENTQVWDRTERVIEWFPKPWIVFSYYNKNFFVPFKEKFGQLVDEAGNLNYELLEQLNPNSKEFAHFAEFNGFDKAKFTEGSGEAIKQLKALKEQADKIKAELEKYVQESFGELGSGFADSIVSAVEKGTNAFETFGQSVSNVMKNLIKQMLVTDKIKQLFDQFNTDIANIYANNLGADPQVIVKKVKDQTLRFVNGVLKPEIEKGEAITKMMFDELEKDGVKMYDNAQSSTQQRQGTEKGFARMSQDSADELNARFTLMTELQRVSNDTLVNINTAVQAVKEYSSELNAYASLSLSHLAAIEANTFVLHQMGKDVTLLKNSFNDMQLYGIKIK